MSYTHIGSLQCNTAYKENENDSIWCQDGHVRYLQYIRISVAYMMTVENTRISNLMVCLFIYTTGNSETKTGAGTYIVAQACLNRIRTALEFLWLCYI